MESLKEAISSVDIIRNPALNTSESAGKYEAIDSEAVFPAASRGSSAGGAASASAVEALAEVVVAIDGAGAMPASSRVVGSLPWLDTTDCVPDGQRICWNAASCVRA